MHQAKERTVRIEPTEKQFEAWEALNTHKEIFFGGGAGGGKSWFLCETRLARALAYPGYRSFIGREELKRLMQSTFITWSKVCQYHGITKDYWTLNGQYNYIEFKNGSRIDLLDLKYLPSDPLYERFGSLEYTDGAIEEAGEVHPLAYTVLKTRIGRHKNNEFNLLPTLAITGNPKKNWTYTKFYKRWAAGELPEHIKFIQALYTDNPHTAKEYEAQLKGIDDKVIKERLMFGNWEYDDSPNALVDFDSLQDLFTNDFIEEGEPAITADIALTGSDKFVIMVWAGFVCKEVIAIDKIEAPEVEKLIKDTATKYKVKRSRIVFDSDGIGAFLSGYLKGARAFNNGARPSGIDAGKYKIQKDQCGYFLARRIKNGGYYFQSTKHKEAIIEELEYLQSYNIDSDKQLQILPKAEIKKHLGRSPDFMDAFLMREFLEIKGSMKVTFSM